MKDLLSSSSSNFVLDEKKTLFEVECLKARPRIDFSSIFIAVNPIVEDVRRRGEVAVKEYTAKFDKIVLDRTVVSVSELHDPELDPVIKEAFDVAYNNIYALSFGSESVKCKRVARSIASVSLYVPGGTAVLLSTALMLAVANPNTIKQHFAKWATSFRMVYGFRNARVRIDDGEEEEGEVGTSSWFNEDSFNNLQGRVESSHLGPIFIVSLVICIPNTTSFAPKCKMGFKASTLTLIQVFLGFRFTSTNNSKLTTKSKPPLKPKLSRSFAA
ncbi:Histidinol dehydrogenase [Morus notabilis]|uniref:Histidinol dehydrogenase n=1 Tax=Morus notabilis TaxID=981085 RepID=W9RXD1_9ROSA|nr:Histidinol dehydrogenase [Morus notabilis]